MSTKDIEEKIAKINKRIEKERKRYNLIIEFLDKGYDITNEGEEFHDKETIERKKIEARNNFYDFLVKAQNEIVEIENGIYEDNEEEIETVRKPIKRRMSGRLVAFTISAIITIGAAVGITNYIKHENEVSRKISTYSDDLEDVIDDSTFSRIGNLVYHNGEVVETLDEKNIVNSEYTFIDYRYVSNYIESSENPDLAAFTLYKNYGRENHNPTYHKLVTQTFKTLEFDGSKMGSMDNFSEYLKANGYDSYNEYYHETRKELFSDEDSILDNIKVNIKKMTK